MAEIVNLRMARKRALRREDEARAGANRTAFGLPKAVRDSAAQEKQRASRALDGRRLDPSSGEGATGAPAEREEGEDISHPDTHGPT